MPEADPPEPASSEAAPEPRTVIIGVISAPGTSTELAERLRPDLTERIGARLPSVRWVVRFVSDRLVDGPADLSQLISAARRRLIDEQWHLTVCVTDLPLQTARRPVVAHASMTHGVAVLSLPALGAVGVTRRAADALVRLVAALVGDADRANLDAHPTTGTRGRAHPDVQRRRGAVTRRLQELGDAVAPDSCSRCTGPFWCSTWSAHFCSFPASHSPMRWATTPASPAWPGWRGWRRRSPPWAVPWVRAWKPTRRYARRRTAIRQTRNSPADRTFGGHSRRTRLTGDRCEDQQKRVGDQTRHEPAKEAVARIVSGPNEVGVC